MKRSTSVVLLALALVLCSGFGAIQRSGALHSGAKAQPPQAPPDPELTLRPDQVRLLRDTLADASSEGFSDRAFMPPVLDSLLQSADPDRRARGQGLLAAETIRYAAAVHRGRLPLGAFDSEWGMRPAPFDAKAAFDAALVQNRLKPWLDGLPPPYLGYDQLIAGLKTYRQIAANGGWNNVAAGPSMMLGKDDVRVPALKARLAAEYPQAAAAFADDRAQAAQIPSPPQLGSAVDLLMFDAALDSAVKTFQTRHGLDPTGVVDRATLAALNVPVQERVGQILANMERWRWAPPVMPTDRVQVNIAAAILTLFRGEQPVLSMRAVAGRVADHTPMLQSIIRGIVFNPPWNVPAAIAAKELWPKEQADPGYLAREDYVVIRTADGGTRLQQRAGPKSALGQIKFDFDNPYGVYLHDTPTHSAFARQGRLVSHGCVRLDQPKALALMLLQDDPAWSQDGIDAVIAAGQTRRVALTRPTAVLIFYWTAFAGPDGAMNFRSDVYGWDKELLQRIAARPARA
jgi:murein L,D-transpeptidase YcbB/YkuD